MTDSFGISDGNFEESALVASRWTTGGNSAAARRARVKAQRRDKYGRWAEMGGGVSFPGRMADGSIKTVIGRYVGPSDRDGYMRVEITDPKSGVRLGVYDVPGRVATVSRAILTGEQLEEAGIKLDVNGNRVGETLDRDIEDFDSMFQEETPDEVEVSLAGDGLTEEEKKLEAKARLEAGAHVSYNVVDENGNPIAQAPQAEDALPQGMVKNASENMTLYVNPDGSINPVQVVKNVDGKWQAIKDEGNGVRVLSRSDNREEAERVAVININMNKPAPERQRAVGRQERPARRPRAEERPAVEPKAPGATPAGKQEAKEFFPTREAQINRALLRQDQQKALDNLVRYKEEAVTALRASILSGDSDAYRTQYAIVERIADSINELADKTALGRPDDAFFFRGDQEARVENMRVIPSSVKTAIARDPKLPPNTSVITEADAIIISKTGKPYLLRYRDGEGSKVYRIVDGKIEDRFAGSCAVSSMLSDGAYPDNREDHKPKDASIGMIKVHDARRYNLVPGPSLQEEGLGGYLIMMPRWVAQKHGRRFAHSATLLSPGNVYSKKVSKNLEDHHRSQRDKALVVQAPNAPIVHALKSVSSELEYGPRFWANEREVIADNLESHANRSALWLIGRDINNLADVFRRRFHGSANAQPGVDYPAIFESHVKSENPDWSNHDFQMQLLRTAYQNGMSKDEILAKLDEYIALGEDQPWGNKLNADNVEKIRNLKGAIMATDWTNYNPVPEPVGLREDSVRFWDSPFAGQGKFTNFVVPNGMTPVRVGPDYVHRPDGSAPAGSPQDWTENPTSLATRFSADELVGALRTAVLAKSNNVTLKFGGNQDGVVNSAAVYRALTEQGQDAPKILAGIYDEALGEGRTDNADALNKYRANLRDVNDDFAEILKQYGVERPVEFSQINGTFSETNNILFADMIRRTAAGEGAATGVRLSRLRDSNEQRMLVNNASIDTSPYVPTKTPQDWLLNGVTDNPKIIAYNFSPEALTNALSRAIIDGRTSVVVQFANNQQLNLRVEAIRDALQHQGVNTEQIFDNHRIYFRAVPDKLSRSGLFGDIDQNGDKVYNYVLNNNPEKTVSGKFAGGITNMETDGFSYTLTRKINGVVEPLVKFQKNQDGKYDVWYRTDFDGPASMTFDDAKIALGNISSAISADKLFSDGTLQHIESLNGYQGARGILNNKKVTGVEVEQSPASRPDLARIVRYKMAGADQVLPINMRVATLEVSRNEEEYKFFYDITPGVRSDLASISKVGQFYQVKDKEGVVVGTYNNKEDALRRADFVASDRIGLKTLLGERDQEVNVVRDQIQFGQARLNSGDAGNLQIVDGRVVNTTDADGGLKKTASVRFENAAGRELTVVGYTNNQKSGAYLQGSQFEFLRLEIFNRDDSGVDRKPVILARVYRSGRSEWTAEVITEDNRKDWIRVRSNDPLTATDKLKEMLERKGIIHDGLKFDDIVPKRTKDATTNDQRNYAGRPVTPVPANAMQEDDAQMARQPENLVDFPINVDRANNVVQRILNAPEVGRTLANRVAEMASGINAPVTITLPSGKKVKIKNYAGGGPRGWNTTPNDEEENQNINEAAVQGLADLMGVNATPGGLAKVNGGFVVMDPIAENVSSARWMGLVDRLGSRDPQNAQAVQDYKNLVVFNALVAGGDQLHHPNNFLVIQNPDGTTRIALCDGGRALIGGAMRGEPRNDAWDRSVLDSIRRYHNDFMNAGPSRQYIEFRGGAGGHNFLMTRDEYIQIARDKVLPLTPDVVARMAQIYQDPNERERFIEGLNRRRRELLDYLGIDYNVGFNDSAETAFPDVPSGPTIPGIAPGTQPLNEGEIVSQPQVSPAPAPVAIRPPVNLEASQDNVQDALVMGDLRRVVNGRYDQGHNYTLLEDESGNSAAFIAKTGGELGIVNGMVRSREDGSVIAVLSPAEIGQDRNGDAEMAIFRGDNAKEDAQKWLSNRMHETIGAPDEARNVFEAEIGGAALALAGQPSVEPKVIRRGFLNPTSERQRMFARRLVEGKKMSDAERAQYRGVLAMNGLTTGEVGSIIDAIKNNEDRSASEIARSVEEDHQVPANEVVNAPSDLNRVSKPKGPAKRVYDLVQGDKIEVGVVEFIHNRGNGKVDIGAVGSDGKLTIVRNMDGDMMVTVRPDSNAGNNRMVGGNNAVNNFAGRANVTVEDIKRAYPVHQVLPNGDLVIGRREFTDRAGRKTRYEAIVHRTADETFVGYVRQLTLDPNGKIISTKAGAFTAPAHSSVAALNRLPSLFTGDGGAGSGMNGNQPNNWFNNLQSVPEAIDPRTGSLLPTYLIPDANAQLIGNTGIERTGDGLKDALVAHVANLIDRGMLTNDILEQVAGAGDENFAVLSRHQFMDIIERIEARRANPGVNAIPYVSRDKKTIVRVGDKVAHFDANGNFLKNGVVVRREALQVYQKAQGTYEYRDILMVRFPGRPQLTPIAARRLEVLERADGSAPLPAVNEPEAPNTPQAPVEPSVQAPQTPSIPVPNFNMLNMRNRENVAGVLRDVLSPDLAVVPSGDPNDPKVRVRDRVEGFVGAIRQLENGKYQAYYNNRVGQLVQTDFDNLSDAVGFMRDGIGQEFPRQANNAPQAPQAPQAPLVSRNIEIEGRDFQGRPSVDGNRVTFYDESGNEAATIQRKPDGTFVVSEPFGGDMSAAESFDDAVVVAGRKIQNNVGLGLHDESQPEPSVQAPEAPEAPQAPEAPAEDDFFINSLTRELEGVKFTARREGDGGIATYDEVGNQGATIFKNEDGTWSVYSPAEFVDIKAKSEEEAILQANLINIRNARSGFNRAADAEPSAPSAPALPSGYSSVPIGSGETSYEVKHDTDATKPYYLVEKAPNGMYYLSKWNSQDEAEGLRFRRPASDGVFSSKEEADQWIANDLNNGPSDGGNGGGGTPPNDAPSAPPAGSDFSLDNMPEGMTLQRGNRVNFIGRQGIREALNNEARRQMGPYGYYAVDPDIDGEHIAFVVNGSDRNPQFFNNPQDAHEWVKEQLRNLAPAAMPPAPPLQILVGQAVTRPEDVARVEFVDQEILGVKTRYFPKRQNTFTFFDDRDGRRNFLFVRKVDNSWQLIDDRDPAATLEFDTREEAEMAAINRLSGGVAPNQKSEAPQAPEAPADENLGDVDVNEWVDANYSDLHIGGIEERVINSYSRPTPRLRQTLEMKQAFEAGFTDNNPPGFARGINPTRRVQLSDGTFAYLKNIGDPGNEGVKKEVFKELSTARMLEAMGIDDLVITSVIDPATGKLSVLSREVPNDGRGHDYRGRVDQMQNAVQLGLLDYLVSNGDRHGGNWLFRGNVALPIDHGLVFMGRDVPRDLDSVRGEGAFGQAFMKWVRGQNQVISESKFMEIRERIMNLKEMYESMGSSVGGYFKDSILPRLDLLLGIWRA